MTENQELIFEVNVDYGQDFSAMAETSHCNLGKLVNDWDFPVVGRGQKRFFLRLENLNHHGSLSRLIGKQEYCFAQIEHAFALAAQNPEIHRMYSILFPGSRSTFGEREIICPLLTSVRGGRDIVAYEILNDFSVFHSFIGFIYVNKNEKEVKSNLLRGAENSLRLT